MRKRLGITAVAVCSVMIATFALGALVDTDGNSVTNQTLLGDIDMGISTAGDLQGYVITNGTDSVATNYLSLKGGLLTGPLRLRMDNYGNETAFSNNWILVDYGAAGEGRLELPLFPRETKTIAVKTDIPDVSTFATMYYADNVAYTSSVFAVSELVRTNTVLNGGPYLTQHQSLEPATNYTDMSIAEFASTNSVLANAPYVQESTITNVIKDVATNTVVVGYTEWTYSGDTTPRVTYSITSSSSGSGYIFTLWNASTAESLGTATTEEMNPLMLSFTVSSGTITATRTEIRRNANGFAMYSDVEALDNKIENMDTSYFRFDGITNVNQSVQYVYLDSTKTTLSIEKPISGMTKDWLVYVVAETNVTLVLPPGNFWCTTETVTNDIPSSTPTALYFSQITEDTFSLGRQELKVPITIQTRAAQMSQRIRDAQKSKRRPRSFNAHATKK